MTPDGLSQLAKRHGLGVVEAWTSNSVLNGTNEADWNNLIARKPA
jgi:hypothetical protein